MIKLPPDGRQDVGRKIESLVCGLDQLVTEYLNMLSLKDRPAAEKKVRDAVGEYPVLVKLFRK